MNLLMDLLLKEGAKRAYKRKTNKITKYYRCTSGPKKGKLASDPSKCGIIPDPKKVRHGRKVAKQKGSIRVRKSILSKKQHVSKRITQLNRALSNRYNQNNTNEMFDILNRINIANMLREYQTQEQFDLLDETMNHTDDLVSNRTLTLDRLKQILQDSGYTDLYDLQYIDNIEVLGPGQLKVRIGYESQEDPEVTDFGNVFLSVDNQTGKWQAEF